MNHHQWARGVLLALALALAAEAPVFAQLVGEEAPRFKGTDLEGKSIDLGAVVGKQPVLLIFWASW